MISIMEGENMEVKLGKITKVRLGFGGYQDAQFGVSFDLGSESWGTMDFWGTWADRSEHAKYTEEEWRDAHVKWLLRLKNTMEDAKAVDVSDLKGKPVEMTFDGGALVSWRILTEVL